MIVTYADYMRLDTLLALQSGLGDEGQVVPPAELQFIVAHQISELCFKLMLRECRTARDELARGASADLPTVVRHLTRTVRALTASMVAWDLMETFTAQEFLHFRDKLAPSSAAQSHQFREFEIVLGHEEAIPGPNGERRPLDYLRRWRDCSAAVRGGWTQIENARRERTLRSVLHDWLCELPAIDPASPGRDSDTTVQQFLATYLASTEAYRRGQREPSWAAADRAAVETRNGAECAAAETFLYAADIPDADDRPRYRRLRAALLCIETYPERADLAWPRQVVEQIRAIEQALLQWRRRHAALAETLIGRRTGTGGSHPDYLEFTMSHRIFDELGLVRTHVLPRRAAPSPAAEHTPAAGGH